MTKPKDQTTPVIELLKLSDLHVEDGFNVRSPKQFAANVKELSASIEAVGHIDASVHCIQFVERDGKKLIRGGHTLHAAAKELGIKHVPSIKVEFDSTQEQVNLITSNGRHPLSSYEQGTVYKRLVDGESTEGKEPGQSVRAPMLAKAVAAAVGLSERHVLNCIAIREASPEIAALIESGAVSAGVVTRVNQLEKSDGKRLTIIKAAIQNAKSNDRETATKQDLDAIKDKFVAPKPLKAAKPANAAPTKPASEPGAQSGSESAPPPSSEAQEQQSEATSQDAPELLPHSSTAPAPEKKRFSQWREKMLVILGSWAERRSVSFSDGDTDDLLDAIESAQLPF